MSNQNNTTSRIQGQTDLITKRMIKGFEVQRTNSQAIRKALEIPNISPETPQESISKLVALRRIMDKDIEHCTSLIQELKSLLS